MKVLYIVGVGRSGSTLLERMLGAVPGSVNTGELNAIFSRVATQDQRCGCGEPFSALPLLDGGRRRGVRRLGLGDPPDGAAAAARGPAAARAAAGHRASPARRTAASSTSTSTCTTASTGPIAAVSGAEVVVDASKSTAQLFALRRIDGLDLRVINLVRDSRGVANSWNKSGIRKPQSADGAVMGTYPPHRLAVLWAALQLESRRAPRGRSARAPACATRTSSRSPDPRSSGR